MQEGGDWWHTYLVPGWITLVTFPLSIKCIWFPTEAVGGSYRAEIWQHIQGHEGSTCEHHFHRCARNRQKVAMLIQLEGRQTSDLIFERGLSRSLQRVLLIHCPGPLCGDRRIMQRWMTKWRAFALIKEWIFPSITRELYWKLRSKG